MVDDSLNAVTDLNSLYKTIGTFRKSAEAREFFEFVARFPKLAPFNAMLVYVQKPGSRMVASAAVWRTEYGRRVRLDAKPLLVLWPNLPVGFVFDIGDTEPIKNSEKAAVPELAIHPFQAIGCLPYGTMGTLLNNLPGQGILLIDSEMGTQCGGSIQIIRDKYFQKVGGKYVQAIYKIIINTKMDEETTFATLAHELGHLFCGHFFWDKFINPPKDYRIPRRNDFQKKSWDKIKQIAEFEAESVAWLICKRLGISIPSTKYLDSYLDKEETIPEINLEAVIKAASRIERLYKEDCSPYKPLIIDMNANKNRYVEWIEFHSNVINRWE